MEKNKVLIEVLSKLPKKSVITYVQKPTKNMNIPYSLTVRGYKKFYLNSAELPDLTEDEQLILIHSDNSNPLFTPGRTISAIFKAREIQKRSENHEDAIQKCNNILLEENRNFLKAKSEADDDISQKRTYANKLEYYLNNEKEMNHYYKSQNSKLSFFINFKNRLLEILTKKPYTQAPVSDKELKEGRKVWKKFREEQHAPKLMSNEEVLKRFRYNSDIVQVQSFGYVINSPEMDALAEEYSTTNLALQILDGSALKSAEIAITKNPRPYLQKFKAAKKSFEHR